MATIKEIALKNPVELFSNGHRACSGCGCALAIRQVMLAVGHANRSVVCSVATGCLEIFSTIYPFTNWRVPIIHSAFENAAATITGAEAAYKAFKRKGLTSEDLKFIAFGGDGGTYDIGLQALSGAIERRHNFLYVCYNNEAYMNTGIQRSSATPTGAHTTTSPAGEKIPGKLQPRKDLTEIIIAHEPSYAAQTAIWPWQDLIGKVEKALSKQGPTFINILGLCPLGWAYPPEKTVEVSRLALDTCIWPIYEYENGRYKINYTPRDKKPVRLWLESQGRFRHLLTDENQALVEELQKEVDTKWEMLKQRSTIN